MGFAGAITDNGASSGAMLALASMPSDVPDAVMDDCSKIIDALGPDRSITRAR